MICGLLWCFADLCSFREWEALDWHRGDKRSTFLAEMCQGLRQARSRTMCTSGNKSKLAELGSVLHCCIVMNYLELAVTEFRLLISQLWFPSCGGTPDHPWYGVLNSEQLCKVESPLATMEFHTFLLVMGGKQVSWQAVFVRSQCCTTGSHWCRSQNLFNTAKY